MSRPQFTLRALLVLVLSVGCFFGGGQLAMPMAIIAVGIFIFVATKR